MGFFASLLSSWHAAAFPGRPAARRAFLTAFLASLGNFFGSHFSGLFAWYNDGNEDKCWIWAQVTLGILLQELDIYFYAKPVVPTPVSLLCQRLLWPQLVFIPNICVWGEKLIRKFKAVRSYLKILPLSATWRRNFCAGWYWRTAHAVAAVN